MENFRSLKRSMMFQTAGTVKIPRITHAQWGVLMIIEGGGRDSTVKNVAKALSITSSAATQLIDGLVENGYVVREEHSEDRRKVTLALSNKTKKQVGKMKGERLDRFIKLFKVLSDEEFDQFIFLNKKIVENVVNKKS